MIERSGRTSGRALAWTAALLCAAAACNGNDQAAPPLEAAGEPPAAVSGADRAPAPGDDERGEAEPHMAREAKDPGAKAGITETVEEGVAESAGGHEARPAERSARRRARAARSRRRAARPSRRSRGGSGLMGGSVTGGGFDGRAMGGGGASGRSTGRYGVGGPTAPPRAPAPLPQNGVLSSTFVGGNGVAARLEQLLDRGVVIDGERVKIEAFQDRAALPYPAPKDEAVALYAEAERAKMDASGDTMHLQIALVGREGEAPPRPRLDVRLVLDRSGSMSSERKWTHAIRAAKELVERMRPGDRFGLVSYADEASLDVRPGRVRDGAHIRRTLDRLRPGGSTNIEEALALAEAHAPKRRSPGDVALVVLVSDGMATVGSRDPRVLGAHARSMFDEEGVLTTTIGLGTSFDEETMLTVAREGSGSYHFVRRASDVGDVLEDELEERIQAIAQALRVRVELGPGVVAKRVYGSRLLDEREHAKVRRTELATDRRIARELGVAQDRQKEPEQGLRIHLPTFRRGDQHVILMQLEVPGGRAGSQAGLARVHLDYKDLLQERNGDAEVPVRAERVAERSEAMASVRRTVKRTVLGFQAGATLQRAADALGGGDPAQAATLLSERREVLEAGADLWRDPALRRDAALLRRYEKVVDRAWNGFGSDDRRTLVMAMRWYGDERMQ